MRRKKVHLAYQALTTILLAAVLLLPSIGGPKAIAQPAAAPAAPNVVVNLTAVADTYINEGAPGLNFGGLAALRVERDDFLLQSVSLLRFDLSSIPPGSTINSAELQLNLQEATGGFPTVALDVAHVTGGWGEMSVTWNSRPGWTCCEDTTDVGTSIGTYYVWDVATLVDDWVNDPATYSNNGLAVTGPADFHQRGFASREAGSNLPRLVVDYTPPPPDAEIVASVYQAIVSKKDDDHLIPPWKKQDFYLKMRVNGQPEVTSAEVEQRDYAVWTPPFSDTADVIAAVRFYPVQVELWDNDDVDPDDQFNINPEAPSPGISKTLTVIFDACTLRWSTDSLTFGPGPSWIPDRMAEGVGQLAQIQMEIAPTDARSFAPDDIAITYAEPVQTVYGARRIIADKATAFRLDLSNSGATSRKVSVEVTMNDGLTTVSQIKETEVPTTGRRIFFFDGSEGVDPYFPQKGVDDPHLTYDVLVTVEGGEGDPGPPWGDCLIMNNEVNGASLPIISTHNPQVVYRRWDYDDTLNPPTLPAFLDTVAANEPFRRATFPISDTHTTTLATPYFTPFGRGTTDILDGLPNWAAAEPGQTLVWENIGAMAAGIERMVLVPRQTFWENNAFRLTTGTSTTLGLSLAEWGPHVVIAEAGTSQTAVHELGHTYELSRRPCSTGGLGEALFLAGCRDEYNHTTGDGRPYLADGYDVLGQIYPTGNNGTPGSQEVLSTTNFMDTTGAGTANYNRWIDLLSYNYLTYRMRDAQDPQLVSVAGLLWAKTGFDDPNTDLVGLLLPAYQFEGFPDLAQMAYGEPSGSGFYALHLETGKGDRIYRFDPRFRTAPDGEGDFAFFSFAVEWDEITEALSLWGPSYPADPYQSQDEEIFRVDRTPGSPTVGDLKAASAGGQATGSQAALQVVEPGQDVVISWSANDGDADDLRAILLLKPSDSEMWMPYGVQIDGNQVTIPASWLAARPGSYDARVLVSDGVNTAQVEAQELFSVEMARIHLPVVLKD